MGCVNNHITSNVVKSPFVRTRLQDDLDIQDDIHVLLSVLTDSKTTVSPPEKGGFPAFSWTRRWVKVG